MIPRWLWPLGAQNIESRDPQGGSVFEAMRLSAGCVIDWFAAAARISNAEST